MGKKNKKGGSALAEEVSDTDSFLGKIGKSVGGEDSNFSTRKILLIFIGGCALLWFVFLLTILILTAEIKNDVDGSSFSSSISSGLSEDGTQLQIIKDLLEKESDECIASGLTTDPYQVCLSKCRSEFCHELPEGVECTGGMCNSLEDETNYQQCEDGCACCASYTLCLTQNQNNQESCMNELASSCSFKEYSYPPAQLNEVCYVTQTTKFCPWVGVGFNAPVPCA